MYHQWHKKMKKTKLSSTNISAVDVCALVKCKNVKAEKALKMYYVWSKFRRSENTISWKYGCKQTISKAIIVATDWDFKLFIIRTRGHHWEKRWYTLPFIDLQKQFKVLKCLSLQENHFYNVGGMRIACFGANNHSVMWGLKKTCDERSALIEMLSTFNLVGWSEEYNAWQRARSMAVLLKRVRADNEDFSS